MVTFQETDQAHGIRVGDRIQLRRDWGNYQVGETGLVMSITRLDPVTITMHRQIGRLQDPKKPALRAASGGGRILDLSQFVFKEEQMDLGGGGWEFYVQMDRARSYSNLLGGGEVQVQPTLPLTIDAIEPA